jgi:hypothetical protein
MRQKRPWRRLCGGPLLERREKWGTPVFSLLTRRSWGLCPAGGSGAPAGSQEETIPEETTQGGLKVSAGVGVLRLRHDMRFAHILAPLRMTTE